MKGKILFFRTRLILVLTGTETRETVGNRGVLILPRGGQDSVKEGFTLGAISHEGVTGSDEDVHRRTLNNGNWSLSR